MVAAVLTTAVVFTTCKQFLDDPEEFLSYWAAEVVSGDYIIDKPTQTNTDGVQCIPSTSDVRLTVKLNNPKNFTLVMPTSPANAGKVINFPGLSPQPAYGTDYTLQQAGSTLNLVYKSAFLKEHEWNTGNIGPEITLIADDGREFSKPFTAHVEVNTPPKLSFTGSIGKTANPIGGKHYYVIILKAEDMSETAGIGSSTGKLHKDIKRLTVEGGNSEDITFTAGHTAFTVDTSTPITSRRLLAATEVTNITSADLNGQTPPSWAPSHNADPWALRYRTGTEVQGAQALYKFRLADEKGLSSEEVSASTVKIKAEDVRLYKDPSDPSTEINTLMALESNPYEITVAPGTQNVTVKAKTATAGAIISGRVDRYNGSTWEQVAQINSGPYNEYDIDLPAPGSNGEAVYKISVQAGGIGFSPGNEKVFYVKVKSTVTINGSGLAWKNLKAAVTAARDGDTIKIRDTITATNGSGPNANNGVIDITKNITIERADGASTAVLNANRGSLLSNAHPIFSVSGGKTLTLKNLTLKGGKGTSGTFGGAILVTGSGSTAKLTGCIIEGCEADNGGAIGCGKDTTVNLTDTIIKNCKGLTPANSGQGGAIYAEGATVNIIDCTLKGNEANSGGAICAVKSGSTAPSTVTVSGGTIGGTGTNDANKATQGNSSGGGIYVGSGCTLTMQNNAEVIGNTAEGHGGGVYAAGATVNITNCTFKGNEAKSGGAICAVKSGGNVARVTIKGGTIGGTGPAANKATGLNGKGGAIFVGEGCTLNMQAPASSPTQGVQLIGNSAGKEGGGVYTVSATVTMKDCILKGNTAKSGGAIYVLRDGTSSTVTISGGTIGGTGADANKATGSDGEGGAIYVGDACSLTLQNNAQLTGNQAHKGGGIYVKNTIVIMKDSSHINTNNDVYLASGSQIRADSTLTPPDGTAARITVADGDYKTDRQVLIAVDSSVNLANETGKFTVTQRILEDGIQKWKINDAGKLELFNAEVPYNKLAHYLSNYALGDDIINHIEITGTIPAEDLKGTFGVPPSPGALGQLLKNNAPKKVALKLPSGLSVTDMTYCFAVCRNLISVENIPSGVTNMEGCFYKCENLTTVPAIPATVTGMRYCFRNCTVLERVKINRGYAGCDFYNAFKGCTALKDGGIKVPSLYLAIYKNNAGSMGTTAAKFSAQ